MKLEMRTKAPAEKKVRSTELAETLPKFNYNQYRVDKLEQTGLIQEPVEGAKHSHNERFKLITIKYSELEAPIKTIYLSKIFTNILFSLSPDNSYIKSSEHYNVKK